LQSFPVRAPISVSLQPLRCNDSNSSRNGNAQSNWGRLCDNLASPTHVYSFWRVSTEFPIWLAALLFTVFPSIRYLQFRRSSHPPFRRWYRSYSQKLPRLSAASRFIPTRAIQGVQRNRRRVFAAEKPLSHKPQHQGILLHSQNHRLSIGKTYLYLT
jgi:hypothetical protein